jgi:hypothetical protein
MAKRTLTIDIVGNDRSANATFDNLERKAGQTGNGIVAKLKGSLGGLSGFGSALFGGIFGGATVASVSALQPAISGVVSEYQESVKVGAQTNAVIKSTGGVANVTAGHLENLSTKLSEKIGVDDEAIQSAGNLLLTFTGVRNELGKGNNIYDQAVRLSRDLAVAMKTDGKTAALQLGKALNDPVKGITRLTRAGVTFNQQQIDQIKWLSSVGDKLGAQKIILGEVQKEFGGSAAAQATWLDKLKVKFANWQEGLGRWTAETAIPWLQQLWPKVEKEWADGVAKAREIIDPFLQIVTALWDRFGDNIVSVLEGTWNSVRTVLEGAFNIIRGIFDVFAGILTGDWSQAWDGIQSIVEGAWQVIEGAIQGAWVLITGFISAAMETVGAVLSGAWGAIEGLFTGTWETIKSIVSGGVNAIIGFITGAPGAILGLIWQFAGAGASLGEAVINGIKSGMTSLAGFAGDVAAGIVGALKDAWNTVANKVNDFIPNSLGWGPFSIDLPDNPIPTLHTGGIVPGRPGQEVLTVLQAGERVVTGQSSMNTSTPAITTTPITVHVAGSVITERQLEDVVASAVQRAQKRNGRAA